MYDAVSKSVDIVFDEAYILYESDIFDLKQIIAVCIIHLSFITVSSNIFPALWECKSEESF